MRSSADGAYVPYAEALRVGGAVRTRLAGGPETWDPLFSVFSAATSKKNGARAAGGVEHAAPVLDRRRGGHHDVRHRAHRNHPECRRTPRSDAVGVSQPMAMAAWRRGGASRAPPPWRLVMVAASQQSSPRPRAATPDRAGRRPAGAETGAAPLRARSRSSWRQSCSAPADSQNRIGILMQTSAEADSHGPGRGNGVGLGVGTGVGEGDGAGIGPGSGGGNNGGGPYRGGSGIEPPRLLREVKADYTEEARQRRISPATCSWRSWSGGTGPLAMSKCCRGWGGTQRPGRSSRPPVALFGRAASGHAG